MGTRRRCAPHRTRVSIQELSRGAERRRSGGCACGITRSSSRHQFRLGLCEDLLAHKENQRIARERFHHGGAYRPHLQFWGRGTVARMSEAAFAKASAAALTLARRSFSEDGRNAGKWLPDMLRSSGLLQSPPRAAVL